MKIAKTECEKRAKEGAGSLHFVQLKEFVFVLRLIQ